MLDINVISWGYTPLHIMYIVYSMNSIIMLYSMYSMYTASMLLDALTCTVTAGRSELSGP